MEYTRANHERLFDELLDVLNNHRDEAGAAEAWAYLRAAKLNYLQHDVNHMMSSLILAVHQLAIMPGNPGLQDDLHAVLRHFVTFFSGAADELRRLAEEYEASGGKLLSREEILREVSERRGALR
ncbi:MAG: hypothetical protein AAB225_14490 [Acidobacteriota bacterium]